MGGLILFIVIILVIVPLIKKFTESNDTNYRNKYGGYNSGNRYGGYNNQNVYSQNRKKTTYDWKPDYDSQSDKADQVNQSSQGNQRSQGNQSNKDGQIQNASGAPTKIIARTPSAQAGTRGTVPAASNTRPSSAAASTRPSSSPANAKPFSTVVSSNKPASAGTNSSRKRDTAASIRKELHKEKEAGMNVVSSADSVHVSDMLLEQDAKMPEYRSFEYNAVSYDIPESDAFMFSDVIVDSEVHVDAVIPGLEDKVKTDKQA